MVSTAMLICNGAIDDVLHKAIGRIRTLEHRIRNVHVRGQEVKAIEERGSGIALRDRVLVSSIDGLNGAVCLGKRKSRNDKG